MAKKHSPEQIENILRQIEAARANGKTHPLACREAGITEQTFCRTFAILSAIGNRRKQLE